jgi:hypothetical protein
LFCSPEGPRRDFAAPKQIDPEADHLDHLSASVVAKNFRHGWRGASASATLTRLLDQVEQKFSRGQTDGRSHRQNQRRHFQKRSIFQIMIAINSVPARVDASCQ